MYRTLYRKPFTIFWILSTAVIVLLDQQQIFSSNGIDGPVLLIGNIILFIATAISYFITGNSLSSTNARRSVGSLYGSFMVKFFIIAVAAFAYIMAVKKQVNRPALMICMALYIVYTFLEVSTLQKELRRKKNGQERSSA